MIPVYHPGRDVEDRRAEYMSAIGRVLDRGDFIMGQEVDQLEGELARYVGVKHCVAMGSGTDALVAALLAVGIGPGDRVVTTPFSWISTAEAVLLLGAVPVFADIDPITFSLSPERVEEVIEGAKAVIVVSLYGHPADMERFEEIGIRYGVAIIEDGAQSFGATIRLEGGDTERRSCSWGDIGCTSFYPSKPLGAFGDAGACFTNDDELANALRDIREHGRWERLGFNGRMDTVQASILLVKLAHFEASLARRYENANLFNIILGIAGLDIPQTRVGSRHTFAQYVLRVPAERREAFIDYLEEHHVSTSIHYNRCLHQLPQFAAYAEGREFPVAESASREVVSLPVYPELLREERFHIIRTVLAFFESPMKLLLDAVLRFRE